MPQSQPKVVTDIDLEDVKKTVSDLSNVTVKNLKELAKERGISGYTTKKKMELILNYGLVSTYNNCRLKHMIV